MKSYETSNQFKPLSPFYTSYRRPVVQGWELALKKPALEIWNVCIKHPIVSAYTSSIHVYAGLH